MGRPRKLMILAGAAAAAVAAMRHGRRAAAGHRVPGGILIRDAVVYDGLSRLLLGPFYGRIAADVAVVAPAGLTEIGRVLRPGARALIWDFRPGARPHLFGPRHAHMPDPLQHTRRSPVGVVTTTPWPWPWRFQLIRQIELVRADRL
jgi:hypothetical protein